MEQLIREVAKKLNLPEKTVKFVISSYLKDLKRVMTKVTYSKLESLDGVKTNAIIPGLGKFIVSYKRKRKVRNKNLIKQKNDEK